jgi:hypothetical protein
VASEVADGKPSATVLVNGRDFAHSDVGHILDSDRMVLTIAGSGRTADELAAATQGKPPNERADALVKSGLIRTVSAKDARGLANVLAAALGRSTTP